MLTKLPPQDIDIEQSLLASIMLFPDTCDDIFEHLNTADFYRSSHQKIFDFAKQQHSQGQPVELAALVSGLRDVELLESVGGAPYLAKIIDETPLPSSIEYFCRILREKKLLRELAATTAQICEDCYLPGDVAEKIDNAHAAILEITGHDSTPDVYTLKDLVIESGERHDAIARKRHEITGVSSGLTDLDFITCGFQSSELVILAGRPSMGKTALGVNFAMHAASQYIPTLVFSLEMSKEQLTDRIISSVSGVNSIKFRGGGWTEQNFEAVSVAKSKILNWPIYIIDKPSLSYAEMRSLARKQWREQEIKLIVVDYLQLMQGDKRDNRVEEVSSISRNLKAMAKELNVSVIALSQLNRKLEERKGQDKRPKLSDLRESGAIEQDADTVMMLYRPEVYDRDNPALKGKAEIGIEKHRNGPTGRIEMYWDEKTTTFKNAERG